MKLLAIFVGLNLLALLIDPVLAGIFLLVWLGWYQQHYKLVVEDEI